MTPNQQHIDHLLAPETADEFDEKFGQGAAS